MNREIKFRVWDLEDKSWTGYHSSDWVGTGMGNVGGPDEQPWRCMSLNGQIMYNDNMGGFVDSHQEKFVIQQYTGLTDKNNNDIYEGDIIKTPLSHMYQSNIFVVKYYKNRFTPDDICDGDVEIIGNIFENSNLLSDKHTNIVETANILASSFEPDICDACGEQAFDGYSCYACGAKYT